MTHDIDLQLPSVHLSVCHVMVSCLIECMYRQTFYISLVGPTFLICYPTGVTKFQGEPLSGGVKYTRAGKYAFLTVIAVYLGNCT